MQQGYYVPVGIESIEPEMFPDVALYLRSGGNYVLYKNNGRHFSKTDAQRLMANSIDFLYVSPADMEVINQYMEDNAERFLTSEKFDGRTKGKIIYQTSINFVGDIFQNPGKAGDLNRSKRLIENLMTYLSSDRDALTSLETVMTKNYFTFVHSLQVTALSLLVHAEAYMLAHDEMVDVGVGTLLHDFGKIFIPAEILSKTGKLSDEEVAIIKRHPQEGYDYLKEHTGLNEICLAIVRDHHERINGNGYPSGLQRAEISRSAQVGGMCDVYCTLAIDRNGRNALPPYLSIQVMRQEMKDAFDKRLLDILEALTCTEEAQQMIL